MTVITSTLQITDGVDTVDLNGANGTGSGAIVQYDMRSPKSGEVTAEESLTIRFADTTLAKIKATMDKLQRLIDEAARWAESERALTVSGLPRRVWIKGRADSTGTLMRAQLLDATMDPGREALARYRLNANWPTFHPEIEWTRTVFVADTAIEINEATTNLVINPSFGTTLSTGWGTDGGAIVATGGHYGAACLNAGTYTYQSITVSNTTVYTLSFYCKGAYSLVMDHGDTVGHDYIGTATTGDDGWGRVVLTFTTQGTSLVMYFYSPAGQRYDAIQLEQKAYVTPYCDGSLGGGDAWTGTAHASTSTRAGTVYNHDDAAAGHDNYIDIAAENIGGSAPGPIELQVTNTYATNTLGTFWVAVNQHKGTAMPVHILEGEAGVGMTETDDAGAIVSSGAHYGLFQLNGTTQQLAGRWALDTTALGKLAGHKYHVLLRTPLSNINIYAQLKVMYTATTTEIGIAPPEVLMTADEIQDLGVIQLPPRWESETDYYTLDLCVYVRGADDDWFACDFLALMPTDCWRKYKSIAGGMAQNVVLHDDAGSGRVYLDGISTTQRSMNYAAEGKPLMLIPNQDARIMVLGMNTVNGAEVARTYSLKVLHRPAVYTL